MLSIGRLILSTRVNHKIVSQGKQVSGKKCNVLSEKSDDIIIKTQKEFNTVDEYIILDKETKTIKNVIGKVGDKKDDLNIFYHLYTNNWLSNKNYKKLFENNIDLKFDNIGLREEYFNKVYTIDPKDSIDLDDGFSFWEDDNFYYLDIHIADPISYFDFSKKGIENIFNELYKRVATCYIPQVSPTHLLPEFLLNEVTLINNNSFSRAITFKYKFNKDNDYYDFKYSATKLYNIENTDYDTYDIKLNSDSDYKNTIIIFIKKMIRILNLKYDISKFDFNNNISHSMIEIFMIWTNYTVGTYLNKECFPVIFRTQYVTEETKVTEEDIPDYVKSFLSYSANYEFKKEDKDYLHYSLGINNYAHVSSPMRRVVDMINHIFLHKINTNIIKLLNIDKLNETLKLQKRISNSYSLLKFLETTIRYKAFVLDIKENEKNIFLLLVVYDKTTNLKKIIRVESPILSTERNIKKYSEIDIEIYYNSYNFHSNNFPFSIKIL